MISYGVYKLHKGVSCSGGLNKKAKIFAGFRKGASQHAFLDRALHAIEYVGSRIRVSKVRFLSSTLKKHQFLPHFLFFFLEFQ